MPFAAPPAPARASARRTDTLTATDYNSGDPLRRLAAHIASFNCLNDPDIEELAGHRDLRLLECVYLVGLTLVQ